MEKKLYRDEQHKVISGVCAGLADYFGIDVSIIRVIFVLSLVLKGVGFLPYIVLWIVLPKRPFNYTGPGFNPGVTPGYNPGYSSADFTNPTVDYSVPPPIAGKPFVYPTKKPSNGGVIAGVVLIVLGSIFLIDEFDIIPDFDFEKLWPVIIIAAGLAIILSGRKKQPWEKEGWHAEVKNDGFKTEAHDQKTEEKSNDNPTTL